ncbi:PH domain-containing protein [Nocardia terpenica]|uniref:PH domain-containing protein n=1 Tax=Nocardia terpenica TaxID=455432 RepID=UPI001E36D633|nr:PH domain-containing protein [Nocardia terpenica]
MTAWRRLDRRMLLIHPVKELVRYIPVLIVAVIAGTRSDNPGWSLIALVAIVGLAVAQWFTTTYRIGPDTVELRRGLLQRKTLTVPRSRIRSVDVHADLLHRLLGLVVLAIGTGQHAGKEERFHLDGVSAAQVPELRALLLSAHPETEAGQADSPAEAPARGPEIGRWRPQWVRYAPLSLTGLAVIGPAVGVAAKFGVAGAVADSETVRGIGRHSALYITLVVLAAIVVIALAVAVFDCLRYLTTYFGLTVTVEGSTLRLRHGLLTTRQTDLDLSRLRGATVKEPLLLRLAGGAELEAIMTGTSPRQKLLPQSPRPAVDHTLAELLDKQLHSAPLIDPTAVDMAAAPQVVPTGGSAPHIEVHAAQGVTGAEGGGAAPARIPLREHGGRARGRRYTRAVGPVVVAAGALAVSAGAGAPVPVWAWVVVAVVLAGAVGLARDRYRGLGHAVLPAAGARPAWLITRHGSLERDRDCLEAPGIIGWTVRQTLFQRRAGLATVVAATAAGKKRYHVIDVPLEQAWDLIDAVTPGRLGHRAPAEPTLR